MTPMYKIGDHLISPHGTEVVTHIKIEGTDIWYYYNSKDTSYIATEEKSIIRKITPLEKLL